MRVHHDVGGRRTNWAVTLVKEKKVCQRAASFAQVHFIPMIPTRCSEQQFLELELLSRHLLTRSYGKNL